MGFAPGPGSDILEGLEYAHANGARVVNMSLALQNPGQYPAAWEILMRNAEDTLYVAAADNISVDLDDANDGIDTYPAQFGMKNLIVVGASNASDKRWEAVPGAVGSCWGKKHVHLFAPGEDVWHHHVNYNLNSPSADSGTSLAAPLVSATASMVWGLNPFWTPVQIKQQILSTVDPLPANFDGTCMTMGRLNAARALLGGCT